MRLDENYLRRLINECIYIITEDEEDDDEKEETVKDDKYIKNAKGKVLDYLKDSDIAIKDDNISPLNRTDISDLDRRSEVEDFTRKTHVYLKSGKKKMSDEYRNFVYDVADDGDNGFPKLTDKVLRASEVLQYCIGEKGEYYPNRWTDFLKDESKPWNKDKYELDAKGDVYKVNGLTHQEIESMKYFIDRRALRNLYDKTYRTQEGFNKFGGKATDGVADVTDFSLGAPTQDQIDKLKKDMVLYPKDYIKKRITEEYLSSEFGMKFNMPDFAVGNQKLKKTLIINFTSAFGCPAWNNCLLKHGCYARNTENLHANVSDSNEKKHFLWLCMMDDSKKDKLSELIYEMLRTMVVNYGALYKNKEVKKKYSDVDMLVETPLSQLDEATKSILKEDSNLESPKYLRVRNIRLNENGDFINQKLLEKFDEFAREFNEININTSAYTCMNLRYDKVKNIIINASRRSIGNVDKYFFALPEDVFNKLGGTYNGKEGNFERGWKSVDREFKPMYSVTNGQFVENGNLYYKCPCKAYGFNGNTKIEKTSDSVNCYQCNLCYEGVRNSNTKGDIYVFVKKHGSYSNVDTTHLKPVFDEIGYPSKEIYDQFNAIGESRRRVNEEVVSSAVNALKEEAYRGISNNCLGSMNDFFNNNTLNESKQLSVRNGFIDSYQRYFKKF